MIDPVKYIDPKKEIIKRILPKQVWEKNLDKVRPYQFEQFVQGSATKETQRATVRPRPGTPQVPASQRIGLAGIAGMEELKQLLIEEVVEPLQNPELSTSYGLSIPNGILFFGPPGCGKTYIAQRLAEEINRPFQEVTPSTTGSSYIHETTRNIGRIFTKAEEHAPCVIFFDEFDSLVPDRSQLAGHQTHKLEEVDELLNKLNGCGERDILVICATNEPGKIDSAALRSGRLDKQIYIPPPDLDLRESLLRFYIAGRPHEKEINYRRIAEQLEGYSSSDVKFLIEESTRIARGIAKKIGNIVPVSQKHIEEAITTRCKPSIPPEVDAYYRSFGSRGFGDNGASRNTTQARIGFRH